MRHVRELGAGRRRDGEEGWRWDGSSGEGARTSRQARLGELVADSRYCRMKADCGLPLGATEPEVVLGAQRVSGGARMRSATAIRAREKCFNHSASVDLIIQV